MMLEIESDHMFASSKCDNQPSYLSQLTKVPAIRTDGQHFYHATLYMPRLSQMIRSSSLTMPRILGGSRLIFRFQSNIEFVVWHYLMLILYFLSSHRSHTMFPQSEPCNAVNLRCHV